MWVVVKYKPNEFSLLKKKFTEILGGSPEFFVPKIKFQKIIHNKIKTFEKSILEGYLLCHHIKFKDSKILHKLKFTRGLSYFLDGYKKSQNEIFDFVNHCKKYENKDGYLSQGFFDDSALMRAKFISGPFTNMVFDIISRQKNKLTILIGNLKTTICDNSNYLYRSV